MIEVLEKKMNFVQSMNDQCLLMRNDQNGTIIICLYIDNTLYVGDKKALEAFKNEIKSILLQRKKVKLKITWGVWLRK